MYLSDRSLTRSGGSIRSLRIPLRNFRILLLRSIDLHDNHELRDIQKRG